jgi:S1-C subfamily serine protease
MADPFRLTPDQLNDLARLLSRSLDQAQLERCVYLATGDKLYVAFIDDAGPLFEQIFRLLQRFETYPITERFLKVVYREKPFQFELRAFIGQHYPGIPSGEPFAPTAYSIQVNGQAKSDLATIGPPLETVLRPRLGIIDLRQWLDRIEQIERQVCRVEANEQPLGTGFLVGEGTVLTNWHVVQKARDSGMGSRLACRFDFRKLSNGSKDAGQVFMVSGVLDESPCSQAELTTSPATPPPTKDELDYALLAIDGAGADRRHIRLAPPPPVTPGQPLIIVQHPNGEPMRFAIDTDSVIRYEANMQRLRYRTNTEKGSSGSPCFSMDFDLVALHHLGEKGSAAQGYNQGIPIGLVRDRIVANGHAARLGA